MESSYTFTRGLRQWWREQRRKRSRLAALRLLAAELREFLRDSMPDRRRARYGDIEYDWEARVNTTAANVGWRNRLRGLVGGSYYQPVDPDLFRATLARLLLQKDARDFTFLDIGSGKGRALLLASEWPFRRIVGVELLPELHGTALQNVALYQTAHASAAPIECICKDARDYEFPAGPLVVFLFNPLPEAALEQVISNLERSLASDPRPLCVLYHNPVLDHVLANRAGLHRVEGDLQFAIYTNAH